MSLKKLHTSLINEFEKELWYNYSMSEEAIDELMLDIIEIVNPIGDVLDEIEERFDQFKKEL